MADTNDPIARLQLEVSRLVQGQNVVVATLQTHTEMLKKILEAAAPPTEAESEVEQLLTELLKTLGQQSGMLEQLNRSILQLPGDLSAALARSGPSRRIS